jgi:sigma-B regulation protein RsbU (phosphoserine phosphatase)
MERIDNSAGDEKMLLGILQLLVESREMADFGVVSGRLYVEREKDYLLIESLSGHGPSIAGKTVSKDYQVVKDIERRRLWVTSPESPGWDPDLEAQFSDVDSAAVLIGREPSYIMSLGIRHHGSEDDLLVLLETIRAAVGLKLREQGYVNQMKQAQTIQRSLLPSPVPVLDGFDIAAVSHPATEVGGDVFDIQEVEAGVLGLMIADASGHGLPAALQARDVVIGMRMGQAEDEKITATVGRLNRVIHHSGLTSRFISLFYGELEETGNLTYVNGGHCPPLLFAADGEVFELKVCGPVLGPLPDAVYRRAYITMRPGETLVLYTDGVTERIDPRGGAAPGEIVELDRDGLIGIVRECPEGSAAEIAEEIVRRVRAFGQGLPFEDDVSLMVVKRLMAENYPPLEELTLVSAATRR